VSFSSIHSSSLLCPHISNIDEQALADTLLSSPIPIYPNPFACVVLTYAEGEAVSVVEDEVVSDVTVSVAEAEAGAEAVSVAVTVLSVVVCAVVVDGVSSFPPE